MGLLAHGSARGTAGGSGPALAGRDPRRVARRPGRHDADRPARVRSPLARRPRRQPDRRPALAAGHGDGRAGVGCGPAGRRWSSCAPRSHRRSPCLDPVRGDRRHRQRRRGTPPRQPRARRPVGHSGRGAVARRDRRDRAVGQRDSSVAWPTRSPNDRAPGERGGAAAAPVGPDRRPGATLAARDAPGLRGACCLDARPCARRRAPSRRRPARRGIRRRARRCDPRRGRSGWPHGRGRRPRPQRAPDPAGPAAPTVGPPDRHPGADPPTRRPRGRPAGGAAALPRRAGLRVRPRGQRAWRSRVGRSLRHWRPAARPSRHWRPTRAGRDPPARAVARPRCRAGARPVRRQVDQQHVGRPARRDRDPALFAHGRPGRGPGSDARLARPATCRRAQGCPPRLANGDDRAVPRRSSAGGGGHLRRY